ncbi:RND efflux system outer membrane lipoprotein [Algibacter lectus]|uniref:RND efflux system outer membrane lipoprotein n=2 Tax=Algibacter lectus TaxID=221126 RepID=A0A090W4R6_9FLAO|nr:RND efflux system outer membrane lipoprotein [Algibacter lectus]
MLVGVFIMAFAFSCVPTKSIREANMSTPEGYQNQSLDTINTASINWKNYFTDPNLTALIDTALANNQELNMMLQQINLAKNEIKARKGEYLPFVNAYAGAEVEKVGEFTRNGAVEKNLKVHEEDAFPEPLQDYSIGLSASWELDIWKKLRNSKKAAVLEYLSSVEGKNFMITNLVAEIANSYYELMALDNQLDIINQNLELQQNALSMVKIQKEAARATELAVRRFEAEVLKNQSSKFDIQQNIVEVENAINFLVGRYPQHVERSSKNFINKNIGIINAGIPSQLLQNRTDIRKAELELSALKLNTKVAKANFYPSVSISAGAGLQAFKPKFLTNTPESLVYSLVGDVIGPLINRNAIKAKYANANAKQLQAVYEYEKTILNAYVEVSNALSNIDNLNKSYALRDQQVKALNESIDIAMKLFKSARAEYTEVLLTQREALDSQIEIIETKKEQLLAHVNIYKALGGGWK